MSGIRSGQPVPAWAVASVAHYFAVINPKRLEPGGPVGGIRLLKCADLVVGEVQVEGSDGFGEVMRSGRSEVPPSRRPPSVWGYAVACVVR